MSEETVVAASSAESAVPVMEVDRGPLVNLTADQRKEYRTTGTLPKPEVAAASTEPIEAKPAGESETPPKQEKPKADPKPKQTAEERIAQLESTIEKIRKGAKLDTPKADSEPAKAAPQQTASKKPTPEDTNADGSAKYASHEDYTLALADWRWEQREAEKAVKERQTADERKLNEKIEKARSRYENLDEIVTPAADAIIKDSAISPVIKQMLYDSEITPDLIFTLASNKEEFSKFLQMAKENPGKAIRYVALTESLISQELEDKAAPIEATPAKPRTQAPKPPAEAGGRAATPPDSLQAALEGSGGKLGASLKAEFLRRDLAKLKG